MASIAPPPVPIPVHCELGPEQFKEHSQGHRSPMILRGLPVGRCSQRWASLDYLIANTPDMPVRVHVSTEPLLMDFRAKNFKYCTMSMHDLLRRAAGTDAPNSLMEPFVHAGEKYYLRSVGAEENGRPSLPALLTRDFPQLAPDVTLPADLFDPDALFSSVLRVSSGGVRIWTHYDTLDNFYVQVVGHKEVVMWAPDQSLNLYLDGDKSRVIDIQHADPQQFPKFRLAQQHVGLLQPGDVLYIPALWFHNMTSVDFGVAVNLFWRNLGADAYDAKDVYGNKDPLAAAKALRMLDNTIKQLDGLPPDFRDFYGRQLISRLEHKCLMRPL